MTDAERAALRGARERLRGALAALDDLIGDSPPPAPPGELSCPDGGAHAFRLLDPTYGVYVCALCGAQEIRES